MGISVFFLSLARGQKGRRQSSGRKIVRRAEIPFEIHYNLTTADAPQTTYYVRDIFRKLELEGVPCYVNYPIYKGQRVTMWTLITMKKFLPTRLQRYCCQICKENSCRDRFITTSVRWAKGESGRITAECLRTLSQIQTRKST